MAKTEKIEKLAAAPLDIPAGPVNRQEAIAALRARAEALILEQVNAIDPQAIVQEIIRDIQKVKAQVVWKVLGMDNRWGRWEIDHCNGRESPISRYIEAHAGDTLREYMAEIVPQVIAEEQEKAKSHIRDALRKEIRERIVGYYGRQTISAAAESFVNALVAGIKAELTTEETI